MTSEAHIHQGPRAVNPAGVQGRHSGLPQEIRAVSRIGTEVAERRPIAVRKSAEGVVGGGNEPGMSKTRTDSPH